MGLDAKEHISHMDPTRKLFLERGATNFCLPIEGKDVAIPLLISASEPDLHNHQSSDCQISKVGCWRQALLVNNTMISEDVMDSR